MRAPEGRGRRRLTGIALLHVPVLLLAGLAAAGCDAGSTSAAPPWVVCGTTLVDSAAGPLPIDVSRPGTTVVVHGQSPGGIDLLVSPDCRRGGTLTVSPASAATVTGTARAEDGQVAAATLTPARARFTVTVHHPGGLTTVTVDLPADALRSAGSAAPAATAGRYRGHRRGPSTGP